MATAQTAGDLTIDSHGIFIVPGCTEHQHRVRWLLLSARWAKTLRHQVSYLHIISPINGLFIVLFSTLTCFFVFKLFFLFRFSRYLRRRLASGEGNVVLGICVCVCVCDRTPH